MRHYARYYIGNSISVGNSRPKMSLAGSAGFTSDRLGGLFGLVNFKSEVFEYLKCPNGNIRVSYPNNTRFQHN